MKYCLLTLSIAIAAALSAQAQRFSSGSLVRTEGQAALQVPNQPELPLTKAPAAAQPYHPHAKLTGTAFYTQSFASLPAGWTTSALPGSVNGWRWANAAPTGTGNNFPINGLINSSTKSNGWLLYNADSVLNSAPRPFGGSITSSVIPVGASHANVMLSFQQYFRYSQGDSCFVEVSSNGTTWTSYPIYQNMSLTQYGFLYRNPTLTILNISPVVGGQANAYIRFRFVSTAPTYSFNWLIDDLMLYDADATDLGITYSGIVSASNGAGFTNSYSYSSIPLRLADTVFPITYCSNFGLSAATNTPVTARYYRNGLLLSTQTANIALTPLGARDSVLVFPGGYKPVATGDYVVALNISQPGDAAAQNDVDTIRFSVTDSVYAPYGTEFTERNCYLSRPSASTLQYWGSRFTIANGQHDTITSVTAAFRPGTVAGQRVQAQVYQATGTGSAFDWTALIFSTTRTLTASDIPAPGNVVTTTIPFRVLNGNFSPLILGTGDYAIVLTTVNATADVAVYSMVPPLPTAPSFIGYQGQSDVSPNDGNFGFAGAGGIATGLVQVPHVHPNFGNARGMVGVPEAERIILGAAYPNPANTSLNVPVVLAQSGVAQLTLCNPIGQVLSRKDLGKMNAGVVQVASIPTGNLPEGIYYYTVESNGSKAAGRVTVKH